MNDDPIVAPVRKVRDELAAFDYDVHAIFADLRRREADLGDRLVRQTQPANQAVHASGGSGSSPVDAHSPAAG